VTLKLYATTAAKQDALTDGIEKLTLTPDKDYEFVLAEYRPQE